MKTLLAVVLSGLMISGGAFAKDKKKHKKPVKPSTEISTQVDNGSMKK